MKEIFLAYDLMRRLKSEDSPYRAEKEVSGITGEHVTFIVHKDDGTKYEVTVTPVG